jgi:polyisoprenoid-binding protein YceI
MSRFIKWVIAIGAGVVVLAVGGAYIYTRIDKAPPKLKLSSDSSVTTTAGGSAGTTATVSGDISGSWHATAASIVGYRVKETLFGSSNEAYGRTSKVTGTMTIAGTTVSTTSLTVDMTSVSSDRSQRDQYFRGRIMNTSTYPTATFKLTSPVDLGSVPAVSTPVSSKATGELTLHGVTKTVTFDLKSQRKADGTIETNGTIPIKFADYNISDPSGGPAQISDQSGTLEFLIVFAHA